MSSLLETVFKCVVASFAVILIGLAIELFGNRQFGGFDQSVLVDLAYRLAQGQKAYVDFYQTTPVLFLLGVDWARFFFGFTWAGLIHFTALFSICIFILQLWSLHRSGVAYYWALTVAFVVQALSCVFTGYWWYNCSTSAVAALFATVTVLVIRNKWSLMNWVFYSFCMTVMLLGKPNVAFPLVVFSVLSLLLTKNSKIIISGCLAGLFSLLLVTIITGIYGTNPIGVLEVFRSVGARAIPTYDRFRQGQGPVMSFVASVLLLAMLVPSFLAFKSVDFFRFFSAQKLWVKLVLVLLAVMFVWRFARGELDVCALYACFGLIFVRHSLSLILVFIAGLALWLFRDHRYELFFSGSLLVILISYFRKPSAIFFFSFGAIWTAWFACFTNGEPKWTDMPLALTGVSALVLLSGRCTILSERILSVLMLVLAVSGFWFGSTRYRIQRIGDGSFFQHEDLLVVANKNKFFASLKASPNFHSVLDDMSKVVQEVRRKKANARFFLGIRLEFGYAALELPSPKGFPLWWHPGVSYPETLTSVLDAKFKEEFDVYITFQRDMFYFSDGMTRFLNTLPNKQVGLLTVFRKR